jgi:hypothetical protein
MSTTIKIIILKHKNTFIINNLYKINKNVLLINPNHLLSHFFDNIIRFLNKKIEKTFL